MKTLIFNGSPRKNGDTASLLERFTQKLEGEFRIIHAYDGQISPCIDCRYCWKNIGCVIQDEMQQVYQEICESDVIVIASPIYFSELTGPLLSLLSRLQMFYCNEVFLGQKTPMKEKVGVVILVGGGDGKADKALSSARILLRQMNCRDILQPILFHNTNHQPAIEDQSTVLQLDQIAEQCR